jgi:predicted membrane protein
VEEKYAMKKVKIAFWIVVFGFVGLIIFQNKEFFMSESRLMLNLGFFYYETPFLANAIFFVAFFLIGILISYFINLFKHFTDAKIIKTLKAKEASLVETVSALEKQLSVQKAAVEPITATPIDDQPEEVAAEVK